MLSMFNSVLRTQFFKPVLKYSSGGKSHCPRGFKSKFATCSSNSVIVRLFLGSNQIGPSLIVFEESSVASSYTRFDPIMVGYPIIDPIPQDLV